MINFNPAELSKFCDGLDSFLEAAHLEAANVYKGFTVAVYHRLLVTTPQWSGNAVSNWNYSMGTPDHSVNTSMLSKYEQSHKVAHLAGPIHDMGDQEGIMMSIQRNTGKAKGITLGPVHITNASVNMAGDAYIEMLEKNPNNFLRQENEPGHMVEHAAAYAGNMQVLSQNMIHGLKSLSFRNYTYGAALVGA